jgi:hypothetical protein
MVEERRRIEGGIYELPGGAYVASRDVALLTPQERTEFTLPGKAAVDVYLTPASAAQIAGVTVRIYSIVDGHRTLFGIVSFPIGNTFTGGRICQARAGVERWEITIQGTAQGTTGPKMSVCAYGDQPTATDFVSLVPVAEQLQRAADWTAFDFDLPVPSSFKVFATIPPMTVRQFWATNGGASDVYVLLLNTSSVPPLPGTRAVTGVFLAANGGSGGVDFRDPHRLAVSNDGVDLSLGIQLALSTTFPVFSPPAGPPYNVAGYLETR